VTSAKLSKSIPSLQNKGFFNSPVAMRQSDRCGLRSAMRVESPDADQLSLSIEEVVRGDIADSISPSLAIFADDFCVAVANLASDSMPFGTGRVENGHTRRPHRPPYAKRRFFENNVGEQRLAMKVRSRLRVICATPSQKRLNRRIRGGSFVACAEAFGNCDVATEGGIPRSSRLGGSLKSLAFMRECPKARSG
jgi:hypothetical protein